MATPNFHVMSIPILTSADLWPKLCRLGKEREDWKPIMLLIKLSRCTPFSNATLERLKLERFDHFKLIKTERCSRLSDKSLNSITRIKMKNLSTVDFKIESTVCNTLIIRTIIKNNVLDKQRQKSMQQEIQLREGIPLLMLMI